MRTVRGSGRQMALRLISTAAFMSLLLIASTGCSRNPAGSFEPPKPKVARMAGYRATMPAAGKWTMTEDRASGTVVFSKKWGGFLRWLNDEQRTVEIEVAPVPVPPALWSAADEEVISSVKEDFAKQVGGVGLRTKWEVLGRAGRILHYLKFEQSVDGDEETTGLSSLNDAPDYRAASIYGLYFPSTLGKIHKYFEISLFGTRVWSAIPLHKNPEGPSLEAVMAGLEFAAPFEDTPGPTGDLLRAAVAGDEDAARRAIAEGADVNAQTTDWTPFDVAAFANVPEIAGLLTEDGSAAGLAGNQPALTPLLVALLAGQPGVAALALDNGADADISTLGGLSPLMIATAFEDPGLISALIERRARVEAWAEDGRTPLMFACQAGSTGNAVVLLDHGADLNALTSNGTTPLLLAVDWRRVDVARLLLDRGADVNGHKEGEWTPLMVAAAAGEIDLVRLLLEKGADVNVRTRDGQTALGLAESNEQAQAADLLVKAGAKK